MNLMYKLLRLLPLGKYYQGTNTTRSALEVQRTTFIGDLHLKMDREPRKARK